MTANSSDPSAAFPALAFTALLAGGVAIGFAGILVRLADVNPLASAFWRMAVAAPLLWAWALYSGAADRAAGRSTGFGVGVAVGGVCFAIDMALRHLSLHFTSVANATLLSNFAPLFIALWMWLAWRARFRRSFLLGMLLAITGAALLVAPNAGAGATDQRLAGDALGLASAVFYAGYQLAIRAARARYSTARLMAWSTTVTAAVLLPLALAAPGAVMPASAAGWLPLLGLGLLAQIGGQTVIAYALAHLQPGLSSVSLLVQPLTAALAAWAIFGEAIGPLQAVGAGLLLWGIMLAKKGST